MTKLDTVEIENLEEVTMAMVVRALEDYRESAVKIFHNETDLPQDIAEDVTREAVDALGFPSIRERLYGKVDVKKAIYVFLPKVYPVALMLDAKAEKVNGDRTATIQMSQTSMRVRMMRAGNLIDEEGKLSQTITRGERVLQVVTIVAKFAYVESGSSQELRRIIIACIPNGALQKDLCLTQTESSDEVVL